MGNITQAELCFSRASFLLHFATSLSLLYILMGHRLYFPTKIIFISLNIALVLANSVGLCKTPHYMAFHLRLHSGFPQALEIMENLENYKKSSMHGKIMEFEKT